MRLGLLAVVVLCSCTTVYDPVAELSYRQYPDTATAMSAILEDAGPTKVYAVGEYHPSRRPTTAKTPLARFTTEIIDQMMVRARHLVVEAWTDTGCTGTGQFAQAQVAQTIGRPPAQAADIEALVMKTAKQRLATHGLQMTCIEHGSLLDAMGRVDFLRLLELVTEKLESTTRALVVAEHGTARTSSDRRAVIVYGGALHNDLYPRWPLAPLSYAQPLARDLDGGVVELDLVVPEVVAPMAMVRAEGWFPLLGRAAPERVLVWRRGPGSYVVILPAQSLEPAKVALPIAAI